jgi:hypothetical protein
MTYQMDILNLECIYQCLNDDDQFYHQFLKGMLIIFNYVLKKIIYINITTNKACGEIQSIH